MLPSLIQQKKIPETTAIKSNRINRRAEAMNRSSHVVMAR